MKIALGMMIRSFKSPEPVLTFLKNAEKYGHKINRVIVAYSNETDGESDEVIEKETGVPVTLIHMVTIRRSRTLRQKKRRRNAFSMPARDGSEEIRS